MNLYEIITHNYSIPPIISIVPTEKGSGNSYLITTKEKAYIAKTEERTDFLYLYEKIYNELIENNFYASLLIKTKNKRLYTKERISLYEYLEGDTLDVLDFTQMKNALFYIHKLNRVFKNIPISPLEIDVKNVWDYAKSIEFMEGPFSQNYLPHIAGEHKVQLTNAINILVINKKKIAQLSCQLIHSDLGADNFLFCKNDVLSVIDFTPEYANEWYSICQFLYWNLFWRNDNVTWGEVDLYLTSYENNYSRDTIQLLLVKAALYRIAAPVADMLDRGGTAYLRLRKRFDILKNIMELQ